MSLSDAALALLVAFATACAGEVLLRRRSADLPSWSQSYLVGGGAAVAALILISLLLPHAALAVVATLVAVCLVARFLPAPRAAPRAGRRGRFEPSSIGLSAAILGAVVCFAVLNFREGLHWDAFQVWASKAQVLYAQGGLGPAWYAADTYDRRLLVYPYFVTLQETLLCVARRSFDFDVLKPIFLPIFVALLASTYAATRTRATQVMALLAALVTALLPGLSTRTAVGGYADMPLAAFVAGTVAAAFSRKRTGALPWLLGSLPLVKNEGMILTAVGSAACLLAFAFDRKRPFLARLRIEGRHVALVAGLVLVRLASVWLVRAHETTYTRVYWLEAARDLERIRTILGLCLGWALHVPHWGLLWPTFILAAVYVFARGSCREKLVAGSVAAMMVLYAAIFLETIWPVELHVRQAYTRLLSQIAPAAVVTIFVAASRASRRRTASASTTVAEPPERLFARV